MNKCDGCKYKSEHQEMGFRPFGVCLKATNLIKAEQNYNAECCPYIVDLYAEGTAEELQKILEDMKDMPGGQAKKALEEFSEQEDFKKAVEAIQRLAQSIAEALNPVLNYVIETIKKAWDTILHCYPNKKVLHLALHHPKERVRKKNIRRIMRWIEKGDQQ